MNELKPKKKKITLSAVIRYVFGLFFLLIGIVSLFDGNSEILPGIFSILIGVVSTPAIADPLESKLNVSPSAPLRVIIVFCLFMAIGATADPVEHTTDSNQEFISVPVTSDNGTTTLSVPVSTETSELATTPEAVTTPDNKGTLDIITNPTGAIVTVDGVSRGLSPVNDLSVDEGNHVIDLYLSGYNPKTLTVYVTNSDTKTIDWTFTPYVDSSSTETKTSEVTPTETPEITPTETPEITPTETPEVTSTETPTSEPAETQVTTSDSEPTTTSNTIDTNSGLLYASSESDVYHVSWCSYVERIKQENLITFDNVQEAEAKGYRACKKCGG